MKLFVFVLNQPDKLDEVLSAYVEIGITGATVVDSTGMGHILAQDVPIFAGFQALLSGSKPYNKTILSVASDETIQRAIRLIEDICGSFDKGGAGIAFTVNLADVYGYKPAVS